MAHSATEKIVEAITQLLEGLTELQEAIEEGEVEALSDDDDDADESDAEEDNETALIGEMRSAIEQALEVEDYTPEDIAGLIATMTEALEEIDPNIFNQEAYADVEADDVEDYDDDDDIDDDDDEEELEDEEEDE